MSTKVTSANRENAKIYTDSTICSQKSRELLEEMNLPTGLLPLDDIKELGYNQEAGFVWLKQKKRKEHRFRDIGRNVAYDAEVTAFIEDRKMKKVTGVKTKELLIWITISDIFIQDSSLDKITFSTPTGLSRTFPVSAFREKGGQ